MVSSTYEEVPVLIAGGGGAGLTASMLLSSFGIRSILVTRHAATSLMPKAHILSQRTMEIFDELGVAPKILKQSAPPETVSTVAWYSALGGNGPASRYGRRLAATEGWGAASADPDYVASSPQATANLPQVRLEPILKAHAESNPHASIRFGHELVEIKQDADGVTATVVNVERGDKYTVRAAYLLGADGGRTVAGLAGIRVPKLDTIKRMVNAYISADLSPYFDDDDPMIRWMFNPDHPEHLQFGGVVLGMGPDHWGTRSTEWVASLAFPADKKLDLTPQKYAEAFREVLGLPDLDITVHHISEWWMQTFLADKYRAGRVFLLGDAAHQHPPTGGLGLNSAVHDAYNLCWKIAAVLSGQAGDGLLDTYEQERRPVARANLETSAVTAKRHGQVATALGLSTDNTPEQNWDALRLFWEDLPGSADRRHAFDVLLATQHYEYRPLPADLGYTYDSAAIVADDSPEPPLLPGVYHPSTRPGRLLPHAWVTDAGKKVPLGAMVHGGNFVLIAGENGHEWIEAAKKVALDHGVPIRVARVGVEDVDLVDHRLTWRKVREFSPSGAVLVRPDGHIAFRSHRAVVDPISTLTTVFSQILARPRRTPCRR